MSENSKIEWTDHTFNPWEGCQKVGPGCDHCYAEARNARFGGGVAIHWGPHAPRRLTSERNWSLPRRWNAQAEAFFAQHGRRQRVFCASLADVFDNAVDPMWRSALFILISETPNLDWLLLTKRIGNARDMLPAWYEDPAAWEGGNGHAHPNVWLGATVVNQAEADRDIPKLLQAPAARRFLSIEPLLGPMDLGLCNCDNGSRPGPGGVGGVTCSRCAGSGGRMVDWVIVGGESGPGARPMHPDWVRDLRDQCRAAGVPFFFKQWGEYWGDRAAQAPARRWITMDLSGRTLQQAGSTGNMGPITHVARVGTLAAGRVLDGRTWDGAPS